MGRGGGGGGGGAVASVAGDAGSAVVELLGFDFETTEDEVRKHCARFGKVVSVRLKGAKGGNAVVTYASRQQAVKAAEQLDQSIIEGNERFVKARLKKGGGQQVASAPVVARSAAPASGNALRNMARVERQPAVPAVVELLGFDFETSEDDVRRHCARVGKVVSVQLKGSKGGNAVVNFAFASHAAAQKAVGQLHESTIQGNTRFVKARLKGGASAAVKVAVAKAMPMRFALRNAAATAAKVQTSNKRKVASEDTAPSCTVRVRGYDRGTEQDAIEQHCSPAGHILEINVTKKHAIVTYSNAEEAKEAVETLDKSVIEGNARYIDVTFVGGRSTGEGEPNAKKARKGEGKGGQPKDKGPDLPRERISEELYYGEVVVLKRTMGFIKPDMEIDHPAAGEHKGEIYVHMKDVSGDEPLEKGSRVQFYVYEDNRGLGAENVSLA